MIDRNLTVSYLIVDEMHQEHPQLIKDQYWDEVFPNELPYNDESKRAVPPEPSTAKLGLTNLENKDNLSTIDSIHSITSHTNFDPYADQKDNVPSSKVTFNGNDAMSTSTDRKISSEEMNLQTSPTGCKL